MNIDRVRKALTCQLSAQFAAILSGIIVGITAVVFLSSYTALIFSGELARHLPHGLIIALASGVVMAVVVALSSSYPGSVAFPQDVGAAIFGVIAVDVAAIAGTETAFPTVVALLMISSLAMGIVCFVMGHLRLGRLIRFIPYPVVAGFMAAIGWLLISSAVTLMTGNKPGLDNLPALLSEESLASALPGIAFGVLALVFGRRIHHALALPALVLGAVILFYLFMAAVGMDLSEAGRRGWLLGPFPEREPGLFIAAEQLALVDWELVVTQLPGVATILIISVIGLLLNASAIELTVRKDMDINRELRAAGLANILASPGGGMVGFHYLSLTALSHRIGGRTWVVGLVAASICALVLVGGTSILSLLPRFALGGLIVYLGLDFLVQWLFAPAKRVQVFEYAVILLIFAISISVGHVEGIVVGILACAGFFIIEYSRIRVVKHAVSGASLRSNVDRRGSVLARLRVVGDRIYILKLQGYIFFGTATRLIGRVRRRMASDQAPLRLLLLDFRQVSGIDSSAVLSFMKLRQTAEDANFTIVFACLSPKLVARLRDNGLVDGRPDGIRFIDDFDRALEWCENGVLDAERSDRYGPVENLFEYLGKKLPDDVDVTRLATYLERIPIEKGSYLLREGEASDSLYLVETGKLAVTIEHENGAATRIRGVNHGSVGEVGMYIGIPRTASILADENSIVFSLSRAALEQLENEEPELASAFHKFVAGRLARRLADTTKVLNELIR